MSDIAPEVPKPHGLEATLKKKVIGPVPLWLVIGIGGGVLLLLFRRKGAAAPDATATPDPNPVDTGGSDGGIGGGGSPGPIGDVGGFEDPPPPDYPPFDFGPPGNDPSPPPSDPVYDPSAGMIPMIGGWYSPGMLSPDWIAEVTRLYGNTPVHTDWRIGPNVPQGPASRPGTSQGGWTVVSASPGARSGSQGGGINQGGGWDSSGWAARFASMGGWDAIVHSASSPAGRISAATTPYSVWPGGGGALHVSSAARPSGNRVMME